MPPKTERKCESSNERFWLFLLGSVALVAMVVLLVHTGCTSEGGKSTAALGMAMKFAEMLVKLIKKY